VTPTAQATRRRLDLAALADLPADMRPRVDPRGLGVGIVHLGIGAFHRAHQAVYTEDAIAAAGGDWGICGVTERSPAVADALGPQDGLYTVAVRGADGERRRVIPSVREVRWARADPEALTRRIADPATAIVTLTVTEKAYRLDPGTGRLRDGDPDLEADLRGGSTRTVVGQLVAGLARRRAHSGAPITVVCCDNLPSNGATLRDLVHDFARRRAPRDGLSAWLADHVRFPSTMVDRIVPATTAADRRALAAATGLADEGLVVTEPFSQWVIEDYFAGPRPAWERAGAIMTDRVWPYERIKLRMLNGSHSTLAYLGMLADHEFVADAIASDGLCHVIAGLMAIDVAPTLRVPDGFDLLHYRDDLLRRFANRALRHRTAQIALDGSQKLPGRLLGTIRDRRAHGAEPALAALGVAAWMRVVSVRRSDSGRPLTIEDPLGGEIAARVGSLHGPRQIVDALLAMREIFGADLAADRGLCDLLVDLVERLGRDGAEATARSLTA